MPWNGGAPREVAVPIALFAALRAELEEEAGTLATVHALHKAGYQAGLRAAAGLHQQAGGDAFNVSEGAFWSHLAAYFSRRGWGTVTYRSVHPAVGMLTSTDWAESVDGVDDPDASCCFSTGFLSGLLSQIAGGPVAVLEVSCRTRGGGSCEFAFGSEEVIHDLYGQMLEGADVDKALAGL